MLVACWSAKGGSGTTVVAAGLALVQRADRFRPALLVDLAGDVPGVFGMAEPSGPGVAEWLAAGPEVPPDALSRLEIEVVPGLNLLPRGRGELPADRADLLVQLLADSGRPVVIDCGVVSVPGAGAVVAAESHRSLLVTRACVLGLRRAVRVPVHPSGVVLVAEKGRALAEADVGNVVGAPVVAVISEDPVVARAVDCGLFAARLPRGFLHALERVA